MTSVKFFLLACAVAFITVKEGQAESAPKSISCFVCNSHEDSRCADKEPPAEFMRNCTTEKNGEVNSMCRKTIQIIEFAVNSLPPDTRTIRTCGFVEGSYKNKCYQRSGFGGRQEVCSCSDKDGCNGSSSLKATFALLLAAFIVFIARI